MSVLDKNDDAQYHPPEKFVLLHTNDENEAEDVANNC
jgi:hypothetical protein